MAGHATFAPSASKRWMTCPGSHLPASLVPSTDSEYAQEGTRLHDIAATWLTRQALKESVVIPTDDFNFLKDYLAVCEALMKDSDWYGIEQPVRFSDDLFGTADFLAKEGAILHVIDLKTGRGVQVSPEENTQLMTYAVCAMADKALAKMLKHIKAFNLVIAQPSIDGPVEIRQWKCSIERIVRHRMDLLDAMTACLQPQANFVAGEHCRFCPIKPACPELTSMTRSALALPALAGLSPQGIAGWLDKADLIQTWLDGLRETAHRAVEGGTIIPGYALKPKRATRSWADEETVAAVARAKRLKIFQPLKLMSPAMAEKAHPKLPEELKRQIVAISSGTNLVKDSSVTGESPAKVNQIEAMRNFKLKVGTK